jgi:hypothetical protein
LFGGDSTIVNAINGVKGQSSTPTCTATSTGATYAISATLKSTSGSWCVDSSGNATTTVVQADGLCI